MHPLMSSCHWHREGDLAQLEFISLVGRLCSFGDGCVQSTQWWDSDVIHALFGLIHLYCTLRCFAALGARHIRLLGPESKRLRGEGKWAVPPWTSGGTKRGAPNTRSCWTSLIWRVHPILYHIRGWYSAIDRLHYKGHCACCEAYDLNTYNEYSTALRKFNSQANEQTNSGLQTIATQLHYMSGWTALKFLKEWFGQRNMRKRHNLCH